MTIPWVNQSFGYQTHITGQFLHLDATTSLQFRSLAMSETLHYDIRICYPRVWNEHQEWIVNLTGCKATLSLIFNHKKFFQSLIDDWSDKTRLDLIKFVPYTWRFQIVLKEFELLTLANEYNWIDCSSNYQGKLTVIYPSFRLPVVYSVSPFVCFFFIVFLFFLSFYLSFQRSFVLSS